MHRCSQFTKPIVRYKTCSRMSRDTKRLFTSLSNQQRSQVITSFHLTKQGDEHNQYGFLTSSTKYNKIITNNNLRSSCSFIHCYTLDPEKNMFIARTFSSSTSSKVESEVLNEKNILDGDPPSNTSFSFAIVDHSEAYEDSMSGRHGKQLSLAYNEGLGADDEDEDEDFFLNFDEPEEDEEIDEGDDDNDMKDDEIYDDEEELHIDSEEEAKDDNEKIYNNDGSLATYSKSELISMRSGAPAGGSFAIIQLKGFQHKIAVHDLIITNKLKPTNLWKVGQTLTIKGSGIVKPLDNVTNDDDDDDEYDDEGSENESRNDIGEILLVGSPEKTYVGLPAVKGAEVDVMVEEITRDKTVIVFKKKRRKNYRRKNGFRREVTFLRVLDIRMPSP